MRGVKESRWVLRSLREVELRRRSHSSYPFKHAGKFRLPLVAVGYETLFVRHQLFPQESVELVVRGLHYCIDRTYVLAHPAVYALPPVYIVLRGSSLAILSRLAFNSDAESRANLLAQLARDAAFFSGGIPSQRVFATEART